MKFCFTPLTICETPTPITASPIAPTRTWPNGTAISFAEIVSSPWPDCEPEPMATATVKMPRAR